MRNRIKNYGKNFKNLEGLLKDINKTQDIILSDADVLISEKQNKVLPPWAINYQKILIYERHNKDILEKFTSSEDVTALIEALNTVGEILKDLETPEDIKALLTYFFRLRLIVLSRQQKENAFIKELFDRRNEAPRDNPLRQLFLHEYIHDKVYFRFYEQRYKEMEARGEDPEDYEDNTPEGLERANKEWKEHFNELCREYGEEGLINWKDDLSYLKNLSEDLKKDLKIKDEFIDEVIKKLDKGDTPTS